MAIKHEGILFGDIFVNNKELFIDIFTQYYLQNSVEIDAATSAFLSQLNRMGKSVSNKNVQEFEATWEHFRSIVLLSSQQESYLTIYRGNGGNIGQMSGIINHAEAVSSGVISTSKILSLGQTVNDNAHKINQAQKAEDFLRSHFSNFLMQLAQPISNIEFSKMLKSYQLRWVKDYYQKHIGEITGESWQNVFYGESSKQGTSYFFGGRGIGQAYDGFMNHIANFLPQLYDFLATSGNNKLDNNFLDKILTKKDKSVYQEEGGVGPGGNFPRLLGESKNHTTWYSSGDILIIDPLSLSPVYNIQLKTTGIHIQSDFQIRVAQLRDFVRQFAAVNNSPREKAEILFNNLLTSVSNRRDFNARPQQEINNAIKQSLTSKLNSMGMQLSFDF